MNLNIPEQFKPEFNKSADFAVEKGEFTPTQLAEYLERGRLSAEMMIRYMEGTGLITKGKGEDVRRSRITPEEWDAIGRCIENYVPAPEPAPIPVDAEECPEAEEISVITVEDIIPDKLDFIGKTLWADDGAIAVSDGVTQTTVPLSEISSLFIHKGCLFTKSTLTLSRDGEVPKKARLRDDTVTFKNRDYQKIKQLADRLAERLGVEVKRF